MCDTLELRSLCGVTALSLLLSFFLSFLTLTLAEGRKIDISSPVDFEHTVHVGFDPATGKFTVSSPLTVIALL